MKQSIRNIGWMPMEIMQPNCHAEPFLQHPLLNIATYVWYRENMQYSYAKDHPIIGREQCRNANVRQIDLKAGIKPKNPLQ
jgi:hypothetical protein